MKAQSNIKPSPIQDLGNNTSYININVAEVDEMYTYDSLLLIGEVTYEKVVVVLLREKYSADDEFALNSKSMQLYLNNCTQVQKLKWTKEIQDFTNFRVQCVEKAREICNK